MTTSNRKLHGNLNLVSAINQKYEHQNQMWKGNSKIHKNKNKNLIFRRQIYNHLKFLTVKLKTSKMNRKEWILECTLEIKRVGKKEKNTQEFLYWFGNNLCLHPVPKWPAVLEISFNLVKILLQAKIHKGCTLPCSLWNPSGCTLH